MGKRIYNGESGVIPASSALQEENRRANAAARVMLLPEIREMYARKDARRRKQLATGNFVESDGATTDFGLFDVVEETEDEREERRAGNSLANQLGLGKGGKAVRHRH